MRPPVTANPVQQSPSPSRIFGIGSIALAGLIGGPLASAFLLTSSTRSLALRRQTQQAFAFFAVATAVWLYALYRVPPDLISQLIPHVPQVVIWWLFAFLLLRPHAVKHRASGGTFRSAWSAAGIGFLISVCIRTASFLVAYVLP